MIHNAPLSPPPSLCANRPKGFGCKGVGPPLAPRVWHCWDVQGLMHEPALRRDSEGAWGCTFEGNVEEEEWWWELEPRDRRGERKGWVEGKKERKKERKVSPYQTILPSKPRGSTAWFILLQLWLGDNSTWWFIIFQRNQMKSYIRIWLIWQSNWAGRK